MNVVIIPRKLAQKDDLIVIPREEYEGLLKRGSINEFNPTPVQKRALVKAETNLKQGKTFSYKELASKLGFTN